MTLQEQKAKSSLKIQYERIQKRIDDRRKELWITI